MSGDKRSPIDPQFADLNAAGIINLCRSLSDYAEAGGLSRDLMLRVGGYASARYASDLEVLLAVGRLYQVGGELAQARAVLVRAGKLAPKDARLLQLLDNVLGALGAKETAAEVIAEAESPPTSSPISSSRASSSPTSYSSVSSPPEPLASSHSTPKKRLSEPAGGPVDMPRRATPVSTRAVAADGVRTPRSMESIRPSIHTTESLRPPRGSRIKLLDPDDPHRRLDPYELIGELAAGGMATVYLGRLTGVGGFQRLVAIKRLHPHLAHEPDFVEMFLDEARLAASIHHPHVVPILEIGQSSAGYYLVMEFVEGDTLATLTSRVFARGVLLPRGVTVRILFDALNGLHAAHQLKDAEGRLLGLIHRDCTPQNILIGADGSSRITDFGVARSASRYAITRSQVVKGKIAYLSPEQATGGDLDRRSDLFSMGIVLWETLTGRPLFLSDHDAETVSRLLAQPIPSVRKFAPDVSAAVDDVCARALQRDVSKRFPTAAAMAEALERAARASPGGLASPSDVGRCLEDLLGAELEAQREAVRNWIGQQESAPLSRTSSILPGRSTGYPSVPDLLGAIPPPPKLALEAHADDTIREAPLALDDEPSDKPAAAAPGAGKAEATKEEEGEEATGLVGAVRARPWVLVGALVVILLGSSLLWWKRLLQLLGG